jgi:uncharacterized membrane protein YkoI
MTMPYDPRPISEGGNRGIDQEGPGGFSRKPPEGQPFRIVGVDTFDGGDWVYSESENIKTLEEAKEFADKKTKGQQMLKVYVYDHTGKCVYSGGTF